MSTSTDSINKMEKSAYDHMKCPICYELPKNEIYMCGNGHSICKACSLPLKICPQCRVPYNEDKVRNRALEMLVKRIKLNCSYKQDGCQQMFLRREMAFHTKFCEFRPVHFCQFIGFKTCAFASSKSSEIFNHIKADHNTGKFGRKQTSTKTIKNFGSVLEYLPKGSISISVKTWKIDFVDKHRTKIIVCRIVNAQREDYSIACFLLEDSAVNTSRYHVHFTMSTFLDSMEQVPKWKWSSEPTHFKCARSFIENPPFRIPIAYLTDSFSGRKDFDVKMEICVSKKM